MRLDEVKVLEKLDDIRKGWTKNDFSWNGNHYEKGKRSQGPDRPALEKASPVLEVLVEAAPNCYPNFTDLRSILHVLHSKYNVLELGEAESDGWMEAGEAADMWRIQCKDLLTLRKQKKPPASEVLRKLLALIVCENAAESAEAEEAFEGRSNSPVPRTAEGFPDWSKFADPFFGDDDFGHAVADYDSNEDPFGESETDACNPYLADAIGGGDETKLLADAGGDDDVDDDDECHFVSESCDCPECMQAVVIDAKPTATGTTTNKHHVPKPSKQKIVATTTPPTKKTSRAKPAAKTAPAHLEAAKTTPAPAPANLEALIREMPVPPSVKGKQRQDTLGTRRRLSKKTAGNEGGKGEAKGNGKGKTADVITEPGQKKQKKKQKKNKTPKTKKDMDVGLKGPFTLHRRSLPLMAYIKASDGFVCAMSVKNNPYHLVDIAELKKKLEAGEISTRRVANQWSKDQSRQRQDEIDED